MLNVFYRVFRSLQFFQTVDQLMIRIMPDSAFLIEHHYRFIADLQGGAILTNRCPNPKYKQFTLVKETEV